MTTIREIKVSFEEKEVGDLAVGKPISLEQVVQLFNRLRFAVDEECWAVVLDNDRNLIGTYQVSKGGRFASCVDPASLYRTVLLAEGANVVLVHNHPSGSERIAPSPEDVQTTERVLLAGFALATPLLDHVIIGAKGYYSFAKSGMLTFLESKQLRALGLKVPEYRNPEEQKAEALAAFANLGKKPETEVPECAKDATVAV